MDFLECVQSRRSVRKYQPTPVEEATLRRIIQAASYAPSWKNTQTTRYILVQDSRVKAELAEHCVMGFEPNKVTILDAPVVILVTTITGRSGYERDGTFSTDKGTHWQSFDAGIATQTLCLAACNEGLGTVVLGIFDEKKVAEIVGIPQGQTLSAMVTIGEPKEIPAMPRRKEVDDLLTV